MDINDEGCSEEFLESMRRWDEAERRYNERWRVYIESLSEEERERRMDFMAYLRG